MNVRVLETRLLKLGGDFLGGLIAPEDEGVGVGLDLAETLPSGEARVADGELAEIACQDSSHATFLATMLEPARIVLVAPTVGVF